MIEELEAGNAPAVTEHEGEQIRPEAIPVSVPADRPLKPRHGRVTVKVAESARPSRRRTLREFMATLPMLVLVPALLLPFFAAAESSPRLSLQGPAMLGEEIVVVGTGFPSSQSVRLTWDGDVIVDNPVRADSSGRFELTVELPADARPGTYVLAAAIQEAASRTTLEEEPAYGDPIAVLEVAVFGTRGAPTSPEPSPSASSSDATATSADAPARAEVGSVNVAGVTAPAGRAPEAPDPSDEPQVAPAGRTQASSPAPTPAPAAPAPTPKPQPAPAAPPPAPPPPAGNGAKLYISPSGNDGNPGTQAAPFRTFSHALRALGPGSTLFVRGGTYVEKVQNPSLTPGTASNRIVVTAYPGERPVIQGLFWVKGADYWTFNGINVTWGAGSSSEHMVKVTDGVGWVYQNSEIWGARSFAGLMVAGTVAHEPAGWQVIGNCIHDTIPTNGTNQDHNVYLNTGLSAGAGTFAGNLLFNAPNGENIKLGGPDSGGGEGTANVTIRNNTLVNAAQPILLAGGTKNITIERNIVANGSNGSLVRGYELSGSGNVLRNNLGYGAEELLLNSGSTAIADGGGNVFPRDPKFSGTGCGGYHPTDATAKSFGR